MAAPKVAVVSHPLVAEVRYLLYEALSQYRQIWAGMGIASFSFRPLISIVNLPLCFLPEIFCIPYHQWNITVAAKSNHIFVIFFNAWTKKNEILEHVFQNLP